MDSYIDLLSFFEERHLIEHIDPVHLSIRLLIPPGSALLDAPASQEWLGELDPADYTYRWQHPDLRMDDLQKKVAILVEEAERVEVALPAVVDPLPVPQAAPRSIVVRAASHQPRRRR